mmetsp:Transcript_159459/g.290895  ORF Transcript_159459/g.290895 Transcript_159459/m.290895 type:complete len:119 (-) Transcript_159459:60-416(-)
MRGPSGCRLAVLPCRDTSELLLLVPTELGRKLSEVAGQLNTEDLGVRDLFRVLAGPTIGVMTAPWANGGAPGGSEALGVRQAPFTCNGGGDLFATSVTGTCTSAEVRLGPIADEARIG